MLGILSVILYLTRNYFLSLILFFSFLTNWFQLIPNSWMMAGTPLDKSTDIAILYIFSVLFFKGGGNIRKIISNQSIFKWNIYLIFFAFIVGIYSIFILKYPITNVVQVFRYYIFFLSFFLFYAIPVETLKKVFHFLAIITVFQAILFLLQIALNQSVLQPVFSSGEVHTTVLDSGYVRYYNLPVFLLPVLCYFYFIKRDISILRYSSLFILVATIIAPMHRSVILTTLFIISFGVILQTKKYTNTIYYLGGVGLIVFILSLVGPINDRISSAFYDLTGVFSSELSLDTINILESTLLFRIGHLLERLDYILALPERWFFGIGLISENSPIASTLPFKFGLVSENTGQVIQVDTGDLIWSPLILTLGILGTFLYLFIFMKFLLFFLKNLQGSRYAIIGFLMILSGLLLSMASNEMLMHTFRSIMLFIMVIVSKDILTGTESRNNTFTGNG